MLCQIHEVSIPHSWYSINNTKNNLYFRHQVLPPSIPSGAVYRKIPIPEGNYTTSELTTELETQLNDYFDTVDRPNTYTIRYNATTNKIRIAVNYSEVIFLVLTDGEIAPFVGSFLDDVDVNSSYSKHRVMGNTTLAPDAYTNIVPSITNFKDLVPFKSLYLHCNEISNFNPINSSGLTQVSLNVTVHYLGIINDNELSNFDYIDVSGKMLRRLNFRLSNN